MLYVVVWYRMSVLYSTLDGYKGKARCRVQLVGEKQEAEVES